MKSPVLTDVGLNEVLSDHDMLQRMVNFIEPKVTDVVLDLGTGKGNVAITLAPHVGRVIALDYDDDVVRATQENVDKNGLNGRIEIRKGAAGRLDFADGTFDLVTCRAAFHHFPNPMDVLSDIRRVLKVTGSFYLMDPIFSDHAKQTWTPIARVRESDLNAFYTYLDQMEMLRQAGFEVTKLRPFLFKRHLDEWIGNAPTVIQDRLREVVLSLDERVRREMHFQNENGKWVWHYNVYELIARIYPDTVQD
jgi:SAM-dependent methyltransferase